MPGGWQPTAAFSWPVVCCVPQVSCFSFGAFKAASQFLATQIAAKRLAMGMSGSILQPRNGRPSPANEGLVAAFTEAGAASFGASDKTARSVRRRHDIYSSPKYDSSLGRRETPIDQTPTFRERWCLVVVLLFRCTSFLWLTDLNVWGFCLPLALIPMSLFMSRASALLMQCCCFKMAGYATCPTFFL
jgi:hypothetical protein